MHPHLPFEDLPAAEDHTPGGWAPRPPRIDEPVAVSVPTRRGERCFTVRDLSLTGLFLEGARAPVGRVVPMRLTLPGVGRTLSIAGRAVRSDPAVPGVALTFSRVGWEDLLALARYLAPRL